MVVRAISRDHRDKDSRQINEEIRAKEVRVIDAEGEMRGVLSIKEALALAEESNLDLVNVSPNAEPPVCKILDYGKYRYELQKKEKQSNEHKDFFAKRESLSEKMNQLDKEIYRLNSQREKLEEQQDNQINYMWNEYEITYNIALELKNDEYYNLPELKKNIAELKAKIRGLGDVNVNSIEEYKSVSERYEFLKTQHDDLVEAEKSLIQIIDELDKGMRAQFTEKFAQIRTEFDKVFKELFGGGKGTIELNEDEDILEAGITIFSQPPGKKLQNMMQLSGGEKALTAIALLFAIQNLKPSPFCLLDEIEAALDDSNVDRFAKYLHNLTKNTQLIVITHRRGTMASADRLYGITMQEKGVSKLVSVDLLAGKLAHGNNQKG